MGYVLKMIYDKWGIRGTCLLCMGIHKSKWVSYKHGWKRDDVYTSATMSNC